MTNLDQTTRRKIYRLRHRVNKLIREFRALPRKDSFSGLHLAGRIEKAQKQLDELGDRGQRFVARISVEVG